MVAKAPLLVSHPLFPSVDQVLLEGGYDLSKLEFASLSRCEGLLSPIPVSTPPRAHKWLPAWLRHIRNSPDTPKVPFIACKVTTPLVFMTWRHFLAAHPDQEMIQFFLQGLATGFKVGFAYHHASLKPAKKNLRSAMEHPDVVQEYLKNEIREKRVIGPFDKGTIPLAQINRFGVIPKSHQPHKWRLIVDLSYPRGNSVNDGVPKDLCSMVYVTIDDAISKILELGPEALLAKIDIKSAFRLIPVHPADRHLLAMEWEGKVLIDTCLPFGLRSAPKLFNIMADLLAWILDVQGVSYLIHYLDDFLTIGAPGSSECERNLETLIQVCQVLGVPLATEKVAGPATTLEFLGILLDTARMEARLPNEKLARVRQTVTVWLGKKSATKREILSLVGLLQHAAKVVRPGRTFVRRMYSVALRVRELDYFTRLNQGFRSDLYWWHIFLQDWNGVSLLQQAGTVRPHMTLHTDASGTWGCGALLYPQWFQLQWPEAWSSVAIMIKELVPIVLACAVWGPQLAQKTVLVQCDNTGVVAAVQKGVSKDQSAMHLLRCLWFFTAHYDIAINIEHIPGESNCAADHLSRNRVQSFFLSVPQANLLPSPLPPELMELAVGSNPDWTSPAFRLLFSSIINKA